MPFNLDIYPPSSASDYSSPPKSVPQHFHRVKRLPPPQSSPNLFNPRTSNSDHDPSQREVNNLLSTPFESLPHTPEVEKRQPRVNQPSPAAELPIPTFRSTGFVAETQSQDSDWTGSYEIVDDSFKLPSSTTLTVEDLEDSEALAAAVLDGLKEIDWEEEDEGSERHTSHNLRETPDAERAVTVTETQLARTSDDRFGDVEIVEIKDSQEEIEEFEEEIERHIHEEDLHYIPSVRDFLQSQPQRELKTKREQHDTSEGEGLPQLRRIQSPSPLATLQRLPSGRRVVMTTFGRRMRPRIIPSRAVTPDIADLAFIGDSDEENLEGKPTGNVSHRSSEDDGSVPSPLTSPPLYNNDRSSPTINTRIVRKAGDQQVWSRWEREGFGNQEPENRFKVTEFTYGSEEIYPLGISPNYTGNRIGRGEFPQIEVTTAKEMLLYEDECTSHLYSAFCRDVKSHLTISRIQRKLDNIETWNSMVYKITKSKHLPPSVRRELIDGPVDESTGKLLWTQKRRAYWHAVDTIVQSQLKTIKTALTRAKKEWKNKVKLDNRWR